MKHPTFGTSMYRSAPAVITPREWGGLAALCWHSRSKMRRWLDHFR
jgi:hypothetical protein